MSVLIEDFIPVVKYQGLNTDKNVVIGGNLTVTGTTTIAAQTLTDLTTTGNTILGDAAASDTTTINGVTTITSTSASALTVGRQGATNPVLKVNAATGSVLTGIEIIGAATGGNVQVNAIGGTNESLILAGKGTGAVHLGQSTSTDVRLVADQPIADSSGNEFIKFVKTASAINELTITNGATSGTVDLKVTGSDTVVCAWTMSGKAAGAAAVAGGSVAISGGLGNTSGAGGAVSLTGGVGGDAGAGGAASLIAGAAGTGTANAVGGQANVTGGAGQGTSNGGAVVITSGASENAAAFSPGASGAIQLTVGAAGTSGAGSGVGGAGGTITILGVAGGLTNGASSTGGAGSDVVITAGAGGASSGGTDTGGRGGNITRTPGLGGSGTTAGIGGGIFDRGPVYKKLTASAMTDTATISANAIIGGMITGTPTAAANYTMPTGGVLAAALPAAFTTGDSIDFVITNVATNGAFDITLLTAASGITLKFGYVVVHSNDGTTVINSGQFRCLCTGAGTFDIFRLS